MFVLVAALSVTACGEGDASSGNEPKPLVEARAACVPGDQDARLGDGDRTLTLNTRGSDDPSGLKVDRTFCILEKLQVSDAVKSQMENTRAIDGRQSAEWGSYYASWSYHPNSGLDIIIEHRR